MEVMAIVVVVVLVSVVVIKRGLIFVYEQLVSLVIVRVNE